MCAYVAYVCARNTHYGNTHSMHFSGDEGDNNRFFNSAAHNSDLDGSMTCMRVSDFSPLQGASK